MKYFTGSYTVEDVIFLLKPIDIPDTPVAEKELLIQKENRHYSEMLSKESLPSMQYMQIFHQAMEDNQHQMAIDCLCLAGKISDNRTGEIVLVSLARAGTPVGVVLKHTLTSCFHREVSHYSISIIRDRGIDYNALNYILARHIDSSILFVDGWTGKGVIAKELKQSIIEFNQLYTVNIDSGLYVLVDLAGVATVAASEDDYLIPSSILNATLSGLISRSILNEDFIGVDDFHGCVFYKEFKHADLSQWFSSELLKSIDKIWKGKCYGTDTIMNPIKKQQQSKDFIASIKNKYHISNENRIKPGIGESTRVLLRRVPDLIILRDRYDSSVTHLKVLAKEKQVTINYQADLPYRAVALIKDLTITAATIN